MSDTTTDLIEAAKAELVVAIADQDAALEDLVALKEVCERDCADAVAAREAVEDLSQMEAANFAEEKAHAPHRDALEASYWRFGAVARAETNVRRAVAGLGPVKGSNLASPGVVDLQSNIAADAEANGEPG
jgi:hypothetical protein